MKAAPIIHTLSMHDICTQTRQIIGFSCSSSATGTDPNAEVAEVRAMYELIFPRLHPHQQVLLVPGVFGCDPKHDSKLMCPWNHGTWNISQRLGAQDAVLAAKLRGCESRGIIILRLLFSC